MMEVTRQDIESVVKSDPFGAFGLADLAHGVGCRDARPCRPTNAGNPRG